MLENTELDDVDVQGSIFEMIKEIWLKNAFPIFYITGAIFLFHSLVIIILIVSKLSLAPFFLFFLLTTLPELLILFGTQQLMKKDLDARKNEVHEKRMQSLVDEKVRFENDLFIVTNDTDFENFLSKARATYIDVKKEIGSTSNIAIDYHLYSKIKN